MKHEWEKTEILVGKPGKKRQLGRPRRRSEDNIKDNLSAV
jgi:hypothetical protein